MSQLSFMVVCELTTLLTLPRIGAAEPQRTDAPLFERLAPRPEERAVTLIREATALLAAAEQTLGDYAYLCRRTLETESGASERTSTRARGVTLRRLARESFRRRASVQSALARLDAALELTPHDPALLHMRARALASLEQPRDPGSCEVERHDAEAIAALEALHALRPDYVPSQIAFELGVMRTRAGLLHAARSTYEESIALATTPAATAIARSNLAEVTMLLEDFEAALAQYDRALSVAERPREQALAVFGKAVVLARLGEHAAAAELLGRTFGTTRAGLDALRAPGVFFEPPRELAFYDALGHEALAERANEQDRPPLLRAALESYRAFLSEHPPRSLAAAAQAGEARVRRLLEAASKRTR